MIAQSVAELLADHVRLTVEGIDRMYLNVYVPRLQCAYGAVSFFRDHRGQPLASSALMSPMSRRFVAELDRFIARHRLPVVLFRKGQRKDDVMVERLRDFPLKEGVVFVGKAQEKAPVFRTEKRRNPHSGRPYRGSSSRRRWSTTTTSMRSMVILGRSFSSFAATFPITQSCASTAMNTPSVSWSARASPIRRSTTVCCQLRRPPAAAADLRRLVGRQDRPLAAQVAALPPPSVHRGGSKGRLPLRHLDPASRVSLTQVLDRPVQRPAVFRTGDPREPRSRPARRGPADL